MINHTIRPAFDIELAIIEGSEVVGFCGHRFVPTVIVGTSGRADDPSAPHCQNCRDAIDICERWSRLTDEQARITAEMEQLEQAHRDLVRGVRERREVPYEAPARALT